MVISTMLPISARKLTHFETVGETEFGSLRLRILMTPENFNDEGKFNTLPT